MRLVPGLVALILCVSGPPAAAQDVDADLAAGIRQVEEGDFAGATITLDRAARALSAAGRTHDLARAYLHLGVAYLGLGSETSAKARFRDALAQSGDLRLDPAQFSPKVIELFEKARAEGPAPAGAAPATAPSPAPAAAAKSKSKTPLILIGVGGAAAAGVAVAAGGGGGATPTTTTAAPNATDTLTGSVSGGCASDTVSHRFVPGRSGTLEALLNWSPQGPVLTMYVGNTSNGETTQRLASSSPASNTSARLSLAVQNQEYWVFVSQVGGGPCVNYTLTLTYPH